MKVRHGLNILMSSKINFMFSIGLIFYLFIHFGHGYYTVEIEFCVVLKTFFYWLIMEILILLCICILISRR